MILRRLQLLNFRQHEATEIAFGPGLTGVIGPNGAGKTSLLEALAWALYGTPAIRGTRDAIRRRGAPPRSRVEVTAEFELGAHRYRVVRSLQTAELYVDGGGTPVANSLGAVTDRIGRILGMTREEFFTTYFTGQKELAVMGGMGPTERSQFLSRVLGYERLRTAQDLLKERRSELRGRLEALTAGIPSAEALAEAEARAARRMGSAQAEWAAAQAAKAQAGERLAEAIPRWEAMQALQEQVRSLEGDLRLAVHQVSHGKERHSKLDLELAEALEARGRLGELDAVLREVPSLRARMEEHERRAAAQSAYRTQVVQRDEARARAADLARRLDQLPAPDEVAAAREGLAGVQRALAAAVEATERLRTRWVSDRQEATTRRQQLLDQYRDIEAQRVRIQEAGPDGVCPTCSRPLGKEYTGVVGMLERQLQEISTNGRYFAQRVEQLKGEPEELVALELERAALDADLARRQTALGRLERSLQERTALEQEAREQAARIAALDAALEAAGAGVEYDEEDHARTRRRLAELEPVVLQAERLRAAADRAERLMEDAAAAEADLTRRESDVLALRARLADLGWSVEGYETARVAHQDAVEADRRADHAVLRAEAEMRAAEEQAKEVAGRVREREARLAERAEVAGRLVQSEELHKALGELRTDLNATLRPDLSDLASGFLRDLTAGRYGDLELNDEYVPVILDDGEVVGVLSGGEEDVANLALRLAISQMIAERAGQPLSLLVLDEIFGSLDDERRSLVLDLLRHLADRFPQVILITHIESVRDGVDRVVRITHDLDRGVSTARDEPADRSHDAAA